VETLQEMHTVKIYFMYPKYVYPRLFLSTARVLSFR